MFLGLKSTRIVFRSLKNDGCDDLLLFLFASFSYCYIYVCVYVCMYTYKLLPIRFLYELDFLAIVTLSPTT